MKLSKSAAGILSARYKSVLIKCLLANLMLFSLPAAAETIPNGTYANETFDSPSDGSYLIEGGTFENSHIRASYDITVSAGTFTKSGLDAGYNINISGGNFTDSELDAKDEITISGGQFTYSTFSNRTFSAITISGGTLTNSYFNTYGDLIINGGKIEGTLSVDRSTDISIDSDAALVNLTYDKTSKAPPSVIATRSLNITGERGISVSNTAFNSWKTSGKITAKDNSLLGQFWGTNDYVYHIDGKTLHTASRGYNHSDETQRTVFSDASIVLNGDSVAGSGYYSMSFDLWTPPRQPPAGSPPKIGTSSLTAENAPLQILRKELTQDEIDTAVNFIWNDVNNANDENDLTDFTIAVLGSIFSGSNVPPPSSITDIKEHETAFKTLLTEHYENFNSFLNASVNANVIISASTFVLNDNAKLINDSFSSDYHEAGPAVSFLTGSITTFGAGNITVKDSTVTANGNNELSARSGNVIFQNSTLEVAENAVLTFSSAGGALLLDSGSTLDLAGKMKGNVFSDADATVAFQSSNARLDGTLSGAANAVFYADYALSNLNRSNNFEFRNITIMNGKTLDIGTTALKAGKISGGTISAILTDAAKTTPIITAAAENVTIKLDMSAASSTQTTLYHITKGTGFKLGEYSTSRYAVSSSPFTDASKVGVLSNWNGGDLYILRLGNSTPSIVDDVKQSGITVNPVIEKALGIIDLDDESLGKLTDEQQKALDKIDDLLTKFDRNPEKKYQVLREVAPSLSKFNILVDETTAKNVINVVSSRFNLPNSPHIPRSYRLYGRSGGDYEAGNSTVWAQGMYNHAEQSGTEGFSSNSAGFTAGIETWLSDDFKAGVGYSYTSTSVDSDRSDVDVYTHTGFLYAQYQPKRFYTNFFAGFGHSAYTDTTKIAKLESEYKTNTASAQIAIGYAVPVLAPEVAVRVINTHKKAYTDALGVELKSKDSTTATAVGGLKLSKHYRMRTNSAVVFTPELKAAATYDFVRTNSDRTALLPNGTSYIVQTENDKRFGIEAGAGFSFDFGKNGTVSLLYDGMFQGKLNSHSAVLNVKINL